MSLFKSRRKAEDELLEDDTVTVDLELPADEAEELANDILDAVEEEVGGIVDDVKEAMQQAKLSRVAMAHVLQRLNKEGVLVNVPKALQGKVERLSIREAKTVDKIVQAAVNAVEEVLRRAGTAISRNVKSSLRQRRIAKAVDKQLLAKKVVRSTIAQPIADRKQSTQRQATQVQPKARRKNILGL